MIIRGNLEGFETILTIDVESVFRITKVGSSPRPDIHPLYTEVHFTQDGVATWVRYSGDHVELLQREISKRLGEGDNLMPVYLEESR